MKRKGFTLIELIVVMAIIAILILLAAPKYKEYTKDAYFTRIMTNTKALENASSTYYMKHNDWPRLIDEPYTAEQLESYAKEIYDKTGKNIELDENGNYYDISYAKLKNYIKEPQGSERYILQNPVGVVYYLDSLTEEGKQIIVPKDIIPKEEDNLPIEPISFDYTGSVQEFTVQVSGIYQLEVWGAKGGGTIGGYGGYSSAQFNLSEGDKLYVYVGREGIRATSKVFNGGGAAGSSDGRIGSTGGGASDIRLNDTSLSSRIIVAGGGGGSSNKYSDGSPYKQGGRGGGANQNGSAGSIKNEGSAVRGGGGTLSSGGSGRNSINYGSFGYGGNGAGTYAYGCGGGGGGGYYGGGGGYASGGGGGGSGYVNLQKAIPGTVVGISGNNSGNGRVLITYIGAEE